jgi:ABC-2 type transport system permease protein
LKILRWSLKDELIWLLLWSAGVFCIVCFVISLYPVMGDLLKSFMDKELIIKIFGGRYAPLLKGRSYFDLWLSLEFFGWFGALVGLYPLIYASGAVSGEVGSRTMEMVLAQPVSRTRVLLEKFGALAVNLAVICAVSYLALVGSAAIWVDEKAFRLAYFYITINNYVLLLAIAGFAFFCAVIINEQRAVLSVTIGAVMGSYLVYKALSGAGVALWLTRFSPYFYADSTEILATGRFNWGDNIVLALAGAAFLAAAVVLFKRKDVAT